ncbi:ornithine carbamoyltransferase, partial [Hyphomicrobium sp.]
MAKPSAIRHFLDLDEIDARTLRRIINAAHTMKAAGKRVPAKLRPKGIADDVLVLIFEKPSTRTRVSFDIAMRQLGGQTIMLNQNDLQLGRGESISDTARVLSRYADAVMLRANSHDTLLELAKNSTVPVINGLTDKSHPCQIMADILTFEENIGPIKGRKVAWVGDGNNVAASWMHAAAKFGFELRVACPEELQPKEDVVDWVRREKANVTIMTDAAKAVSGVDCIVTDTWVSMG